MTKRAKRCGIRPHPPAYWDEEKVAFPLNPAAQGLTLIEKTAPIATQRSMRVDMNRRPLYSYPVAALMVALLGTASCDSNAVANDLAAMAGKMQDDKQLVETLVHDLKATQQRGLDSHLTSWQSMYLDCRAAQEGYLSAVRFAVLTNQRHPDLEPIAKNAEMKTAKFISAAANSLIAKVRTARALTDPGDSEISSSEPPLPILTESIVMFPRQLPSGFLRLAKPLRVGLLNDLERRIKWSSWDAL